MNPNDTDRFPETAAFPGEGDAIEPAELASSNGLDEFESEGESSPDVGVPHVVEPVTQGPPQLETATAQVPAVPSVAWYTRRGVVLAAAGVPILLAVAIASVLMRAPEGRQPAVNETTVEVGGRQSPPPESSPAAAATGTAGSARNSEGHAERSAPAVIEPAARTIAGAEPRRSGGRASRPARRRAVMARAARTQSIPARRRPSGRVSAPSPSQPPAAVSSAGVVTQDKGLGNQASAPSTSLEPAPRDVGALVSVTTSDAGTGQLTYRWSAPVGRFADPTASRTRFFCPETPQTVLLTVTVTDGTGAAASDTVTVQCVAPRR
jgi:hypothetical protein